jgi:hypothetical protein
MDIHDNLVIAHPLSTNDGYTWTLASQLGKMLHLAESLYGPRDSSYTLLGIEFIDGSPKCWYPGNRKHIVIQLGLPCLKEPDRACFQLAHEAIHLLSPTGSSNANVLEEGLASHFQLFYMQEHYPSDWPRSAVDWNRFDVQSYTEAQISVEALLDLDRDSIKTLRKKEATLSLISEQMILASYPALHKEIARSLCQRFRR